MLLEDFDFNTTISFNNEKPLNTDLPLLSGCCLDTGYASKKTSLEFYQLHYFQEIDKPFPTRSMSSLSSLRFAGPLARNYLYNSVLAGRKKPRSSTVDYYSSEGQSSIELFYFFLPSTPNKTTCKEPAALQSRYASCMGVK